MNPNREIVVTGLPLPPADALLLQRYSVASSESVWRLDPERCARALEDGFALSELRDFLTERSQTPIPQAVELFLADLERRASQVSDCRTARLIECADEMLAHLLASDRRLRNNCWVAGIRMLVYREKDDAVVRKVLRELGYPLTRRS